jgi:hypothetical protein
LIWYEANDLDSYISTIYTPFEEQNSQYQV